MKAGTAKQSVNNLSTFLRNVGVKEPMYNTLMSLVQYKNLHKVKKIKHVKLPDTEYVKPQNIFFHCVHCGPVSSIYKECAIAKTLQIMGHKVTMLICNQTLPFCTGMFNINTPPNKGMCRNCVQHGIKLFDYLNLDWTSYQCYINADEEEKHMAKGMQEGELFSVDVSYHALSSAQRYMKGQRVEKPIYDSKLADAVAAVIVAKNIFTKEVPDKIVTSHSCYAEWGSFSDFFKAVGVPVYTWYTGYDPKTLVFDLINIDKNFSTFLTKRNYNTLTEQEQQVLLYYLAQRRRGTADTRYYNFSDEEEFPPNFVPSKFTFTMYPNLSWDVDPTMSGDFFKDTFDWIDTTINIFKELPKDYQLVIRAHPAEKLYQSVVTAEGHINEKFPDLPNNIIIIGSDNPINSYHLFSPTNVGIISNGTVGLEMLMTDIPVIVVGNAHYKDKGFTYDVSSIDDYKKALQRSLYEIESKQMRDLYAYYYFIKSFLPFPILRHRNFLDIGYNVKNYQDFLNDYYLHHICACILDDKMFQDW